MMIAGPANCAAACPVMTKIPAPMMAPIPNVTRLIGPRARFRQCSPDSPASFISVSIGFVANKGLPMQLLLSESVGLLYPCPFGLQHCSGAGCSALQENSTIFRSQPGIPSRPQQINRDAQEHDDQTGPGRLRSVKQTAWPGLRSEEHTSELQSRGHLVCRLLLEKKKTQSATPQTAMKRRKNTTEPAAARTVTRRSK